MTLPEQSDIEPVGELPNGDLVWPGPTYVVRIHGDPDRYVDTDIADVIENHYNVLARVESGEGLDTENLIRACMQLARRLEEAEVPGTIASIVRDAAVWLEREKRSADR